MSTQKEDVLLMVKHVRNKKVDGTLYINSGRVAWRNQTSDTFKISAAFEDIRVQRISPDQKEKVQLQLLMHNGDSFTFQFSDPAGRPRQLEMRNKVKEMLQSLLPKFKDKAHSELGEKFRILQSNPELRALYKELVVSGILTSDEFWARPQFSQRPQPAQPHNQQSRDSQAPSNHTNPPSKQSSTTGKLSPNSSQQKPTILLQHQLLDPPQIAGVPNCLLSDIKPEADGADGIKYTLTRECIQAIFRTYPHVEKQHRQLVPVQLSESEFWSKFFQSHYYHRDRTQLPKSDIFTDCAASDERTFQDEIRRLKKARQIANGSDIAHLTDYDLNEIGYGLSAVDSSDSKGPPGSDQKNQSASESKLSANQLLMHRINYHSLMILKSLSCTNDTATNGSSSNTSAPATSLKDQVFTNELQPDTHVPLPTLDIADVGKYFEGPTVQTQKRPANRPLAAPVDSDPHLLQALNKCKSIVGEAYAKDAPLTHLLHSLTNPIESQKALADISPGGCLMASDMDSKPVASLSLLLPPDQRKELVQLYSSAAELLRHFWACFPPTTPTLIDKLERIGGSSLVSFRNNKLTPFISSLGGGLSSSASGDRAPRSTTRNDGESNVARRDQSSVGSQPNASAALLNSRAQLDYRRFAARVTGHLEIMLEAARVKFEEYKEWKNMNSSTREQHV